MSASPLHDAVRRALADPVLARNVLRATDTSTEHRREVVAERKDWEALRERAAALRDHVLTNLDRHLETFVREAERRGATVHLAEDPAAARRIVLDLVAARRGARDDAHGAAPGGARILKSKSMTTEEIALGEALEHAGHHPLETDLGEYIVQLAGEPPSHITAPALHRSAEQIHDLFREHGVIPAARDTPPEDRGALATWLSLEAREHLRARLLDADVGITGANFLVAETGTVALVENEGNIRFSTTSPAHQIVVAGVEKLVPRLEDLATLLPLLTRSATGQRATTYVQLISGPLEAMDVVLLDGGRSRLLADEEEREILRCIRCGACMNVCPVYRSVGGHAYGSPYPGPIGSLVTPLLRGREEDMALPFASSLCAACTEVCPVRIDLHDHLLRLRERSVDAGRAPFRERAAFRLWRFAMAGPRRYRVLTGLARRVQGLARLVGLPRAWTRSREAPRLAPARFRDQWTRRDGS